MKRKFLGVCVLLVFLFGCGTVPIPGPREEQAFNFVVMGDNRPANVFRPEQPYIYHKVVKKAVSLNPVLILNTGDLVLGYDALSPEKASEEFDDFEKATAPIREKNIGILRERMQIVTNESISNEDLVPTLEIQSEISLKELDASFLKWLKLFAPYGPHNMRPVFVSRNVEVVGDVHVVGNNHLKFKIKSEGIVIDAIAFNFADVRDKMKPSRQHVDAAYVIEENTWNGRTTIQMRIKDINLVS